MSWLDLNAIKLNHELNTHKYRSIHPKNISSKTHLFSPTVDLVVRVFMLWYESLIQSQVTSLLLAII